MPYRKYPEVAKITEDKYLPGYSFDSTVTAGVGRVMMTARLFYQDEPQQCTDLILSPDKADELAMALKHYAKEARAKV